MLQKARHTVILFVFLIGSTSSFYASNFRLEKVKKDTVSALVINPSNPLYKSIYELSGQQIMSLIDSIFELDVVPLELIKSLNEYAKTRVSTSNHLITLTNYYENSAIPSDSIYGKWDTKNVFSYPEALSQNDSAQLLILADNKNYCNFVAPLQNPVITSNFGWRDGKNHTGIDLDLQVWDPVAAAFDGMVRIAMYHPGYGRVVVIRHYNGLETLYAHLHRFKVKIGDVVEAGQIIGLGGSSGNSTGSHLHFEVRYKGKSLNPRHIISFKQNKLISDSLELVKQKWDYIALPTGVKYYTIQRGDFMFKIAHRYGMSVNELCSLNGIRRNKMLIVGRKLRIK